MKTSWLLGILLFATTAAHSEERTRRCYSIWHQAAPQVADRLEKQMSELAGMKAIEFLSHLIPDGPVPVQHLALKSPRDYALSQEIAPNSNRIQFLWEDRGGRIAMIIQWLRDDLVVASHVFRPSAEMPIELLTSRVQDTYELELWGAFAQRSYFAGKSLLLVFSRTGQLKKLEFARFHDSTQNPSHHQRAQQVVQESNLKIIKKAAPRKTQL